MKLNYVTGNAAKFRTAKNLLGELGIEVEQTEVDIHEIQSESIEEISKDKAAKAFEMVQKPLIVNDSGWYFLGLNGFPGPFMKYVNDWLTEENYLDLTRNLKDRRVILKQVIVYIDEKVTKVFEHDSHFILMSEAKGNSPRPSDNIVGFENGKSLGEFTEAEDFKLEGEEKVWQELADF